MQFHYQFFKTDACRHVEVLMSSLHCLVYWSSLGPPHIPKAEFQVFYPKPCPNSRCTSLSLRDPAVGELCCCTTPQGPKRNEDANSLFKVAGGCGEKLAACFWRKRNEWLSLHLASSAGNSKSEWYLGIISSVLCSGGAGWDERI